MIRRQPYWAVYELKDGQWYPVSSAFEDTQHAEERKEELLKTEKYQGKELHVLRGLRQTR